MITDGLIVGCYVSALLSLIVAVVLSVTRNVRAAAIASFVLTMATVILGALVFAAPARGPYGGMLLFFVVPPVFFALVACGAWWLLVLIAKLRGRDLD